MNKGTLGRREALASGRKRRGLPHLDVKRKVEKRSFLLLRRPENLPEGKERKRVDLFPKKGEQGNVVSKRKKEEFCGSGRTTQGRSER